MDKNCSLRSRFLDFSHELILLGFADKPEIDLAPEISKGASNKGGVGKLTCRAKGAPNVTFAWSREGSVISPTSDPVKYKIQYNQVSENF